MNNFIILLTACMMLAIASCGTKTQNNEISNEQRGQETKANQVGSVDSTTLEDGRVTLKIDSKAIRDTSVLLANIDGKNIYWEQKGYNCQIAIKRNGKEMDVIEIDSWLPFAPQGCEVEEGKWVRFLVGVDGYRMTWEDIMYSTTGYAESKITVYGSPYKVERMKYLEMTFPPSMAGHEESCPVNVNAFVLPQIEERETAPHAYKALTGEKAVASFRPASFYEAFEQYAHDFYNNTADGDIIGNMSLYCIPVWMNEQYGAITYLYYSVEKPAMNYFIDAFYQTTIRGRNTPLGFVDIFKKGADQYVIKLLNQEMRDTARYGGNEIIEDVDSYHFALTRKGVVVTVNDREQGEVSPFQLLPYQEIEELLTSEVIKLIAF